MQNFSTVRIAQQLLQPVVSQATWLLDATAGNGKDSLFLATSSPAAAKLLVFDIQQTALEHTRRRLAEADLAHKAAFILDSHANLAAHWPTEAELDVAMFNLGYLPGGDHGLTTTEASTLPAVEACLSVLKVGGIIAITAYTGHPEGAVETMALEGFLAQLSNKTFAVGCWKLVNHLKKPSQLYLIEKVR